MTKQVFKHVVGLFFVVTIFAQSATVVSASPSWSGFGTVEFKDEEERKIYDPENPGQVIDPGLSPTTDGPLRIDFVPSFNFWEAEIKLNDTVAFSNAQLLHGNTGGPRGNFIQVSDLRNTGAGWLLQVRQDKQFYNESTINKELNGAVLSFDRSWPSSTQDMQKAPIVSKDVVRIDNIGTTYNLATAEAGAGEGVWTISFGASVNNSSNQGDTLSPRLDANGNPYKDQEFEEQPIYKNNAISLSIPGAIKIDPVAYKTELTWILSELP